MSPVKIKPEIDATPIVRIAEPGKAKATGNPTAKAPAIDKTSNARKKSSIIS
jgi:hypothetical protein